jgi:hypothetical protein
MKRERVHNHREGKICGVNGGVINDRMVRVVCGETESERRDRRE